MKPHELPLDNIIQIFDYLDIKSIFAFYNTCQGAHKLLLEEYITQYIYYKINIEINNLEKLILLN